MFVLVTVNLPAVLCAVLIGWFAAISALAARAVAASVAAPVHTVRLMPALPHTTGRHRSGEVCRGPGRLANAASGARAPRAPHRSQRPPSMCQRASLFARGRGNILPGNARDVIAAYTHGMADERPLRDGLVRQPARGIPRRLLCASRAEAGREAPFDRDYYRRFYFNPRTAVATREEMRARARLIAALTAHAGLPVRRFLEAGLGFWLRRGAPLTLWELECR